MTRTPAVGSRDAQADARNASAIQANTMAAAALAFAANERGNDLSGQVLSLRCGAAQHRARTA